MYSRMREESLEGSIKFATEEEGVSDQSTPWFIEHTRNIINPILRFHNQIIDFAEYVSPSEQEHLKKTEIYQRIHKASQQFIPNGQLMSPLFDHQVYLKDTELQVFLVTKADPKEWNALGNKIISSCGFTSYSMSSEQIQPSGDFRIICQDNQSGIQIWFTMVPPSWEVYLREISPTIAGVPELRYLFLVNWCMVRQRSLHTGIKSLLIFGICNFFMFERRKQRSRTLAEGMIKFLEFFGVGSAHERRIVYKEGKIFECTLSIEQKLFQFQIAENVNISTNSVREYFKVIQNRYRVIGNFFYVPGSSVVAHLVNPCLREFFY